MTRWVRCGSSQKHKKMPGNATKWGEFDNQHAREIPPKKKKNVESQIDLSDKIKSLLSASSHKDEESLEENVFHESKHCLTGNSSKMDEQEITTFDENHLNVSSSKNKQYENVFLIDKMHDAKIKKKKKRNNLDNEQLTLGENTDDVHIGHEKIKFENDCSIGSQNSKSLKKVNCDDFAESKIISEESSIVEHDKKKRKKKKRSSEIGSNKIDEQNNSSFDESLLKISPSKNKEENNAFLTSKMHDVKIKKKKKRNNFEIEQSPLEENTDVVPIRHKKIKLKSDCLIDSQNNKLLGKDNHCGEYAKNSVISDESFIEEHDKKKKKKKKKNKGNSESFSMNDGTVETFLSTTFENSSESHCIKQEIEFTDTPDKTTELDQSFEGIKKSSKKQKVKKISKMNDDSSQSSVNNESCKNSSSKVFEKKKEQRLKKLKQKREELGLIQLPHNAENKLCKIKKRLKEKGFPPEKLKEIMRQERRKEELKFRKVYNPRKLCFGCREPGHVFADCPTKSESLKQETGICFKCGSVEHVSYKCPENIQGFPYAKCFICKEQGHISRECPQNEHGVYPKGGRCKLCGNVNHLKKDCPTLKKKESQEEEITLPTLSEAASIDAEVVKKEEIKKKNNKKQKIVKF